MSKRKEPMEPSVKKEAEAEFSATTRSPWSCKKCGNPGDAQCECWQLEKPVEKLRELIVERAKGEEDKKGEIVGRYFVGNDERTLKDQLVDHLRERKDFKLYADGDIMKFPEGAYWDLVRFTSQSIKNGKKSAHVHVFDEKDAVWSYCDKNKCQDYAKNKENIREVLFPETPKRTSFALKFGE